MVGQWNDVYLTTDETPEIAFSRLVTTCLECIGGPPMHNAVREEVEQFLSEHARNHGYTINPDTDTDSDLDKVTDAIHVYTRYITT